MTYLTSVLPPWFLALKDEFIYGTYTRMWGYKAIKHRPVSLLPPFHVHRPTIYIPSLYENVTTCHFYCHHHGTGEKRLLKHLLNTCYYIQVNPDAPLTVGKMFYHKFRRRKFEVASQYNMGHISLKSAKNLNQSLT
jgi:hypothetical protein